ncbi:MAG: hypothetical protein ABIA78_03260 [archaeon]
MNSIMEEIDEIKGSTFGNSEKFYLDGNDEGLKNGLRILEEGLEENENGMLERESDEIFRIPKDKIKKIKKISELLLIIEKSSSIEEHSEAVKKYLNLRRSKGYKEISSEEVKFYIKNKDIYYI